MYILAASLRGRGVCQNPQEETQKERGEKKEGKLADMKMLRMKIYITAQKLTTAKKKNRLRRAESFSSGLRPSSESGQFVGSF